MNGPSSREEIEAIVEEAIEARVQEYRSRLRYFGYGLAGFIGLLVLAGLLGRADLIRSVHDLAFPRVQSRDLVVSYEGFLEIKPIQHEPRSRSLSFYARPGQTVRLYARVVNPPGGAGSPQVVASVDGTQWGDPKAQFSDALHDVTHLVRWESDGTTNPEIHQVTFSLDDTSPVMPADGFGVLALVLVYGNPGDG